MKRARHIHAPPGTSARAAGCVTAPGVTRVCESRGHPHARGASVTVEEWVEAQVVGEPSAQGRRRGECHVCLPRLHVRFFEGIGLRCDKRMNLWPEVRVWPTAAGGASHAGRRMPLGPAPLEQRYRCELLHGCGCGCCFQPAAPARFWKEGSAFLLQQASLEWLPKRHISRKNLPSLTLPA